MSIKIPSEEMQIEIEKLLARGACYRFLSFLLRHPKTVEGHCPWGDLEETVSEALEVLNFSGKDSLKNNLHEITCELKEKNLTQYTRLYESHFGYTVNSSVPIYELEYGEAHSHREPQELADITAFYQAFGLKLHQKNHERGDHAAVECEFMNFLILKEAYALENDMAEQAEISREAAKHFLSGHLGFWIPSFAMRLARRSGQGMMKHIADFILFFVVEDCKAHGVAPGPNDLPVRVVQEKVEAGCVSCTSTQAKCA